MRSRTAKLPQGKGKSDSLVRQFADVEHILMKLSGSRGLLIGPRLMIACMLSVSWVNTMVMDLYDRTQGESFR